MCNGVSCEWKKVNKGTTQGSVSGPYLFNLFLDDLEIDSDGDIDPLVKYADDGTILVPVPKELPDPSSQLIDQYMDWTVANEMHCSTSKCKELVVRKKSNDTVYPTLYNIKQQDSITLLGLVLQSNCKFSLHIKSKLYEANKCLFIIRSLRKEGYDQAEIDHIFNSIVLPKILYALPVYAASLSDLTAVQSFLTRCYKRRYTSILYNIYDLLEKYDRRLVNKINNNGHPLYNMLPKTKLSSQRLRKPTCSRPKINTERFKNSFFNRIIFKYNIAL